MSDEEHPASRPGADLADAAVWLALGGAVLIGSITMDRLENQDINPYTIPGLLPGLLGIALLLLGGLLLLRSVRRGARLRRPQLRGNRRVATVIFLCVVFGTVLVGHGLPFWLAATSFVGAAITMLQTRAVSGRTLATAVIIGACAGTVITVLFQDIFLVRLP